MPRIVIKQIGEIKVDWIEPNELARYLDSLEKKIAALEARIAILEAKP
jgi:hypothetical protein